MPALLSVRIGFHCICQSRQNHRGPILEQIAEGHANVAQGAAEIFAICRALEIARQRGFARIKLRSDYNALRRSLREQYRSGRNDVAIRGLVLQLAQTFEWIDFGYVPCRKNQAAADDETVRIISARLAERHERRTYENG